MRKKIIVLFLLAGIVWLGSAAVTAPLNRYKNLQILPRDISEVKMDSIMNAYNRALGVNCKFCHVALKTIPDSLDYASDAEPMKEQARRMMRMNIYINQTYFNFDKNERPEYLKTVSCFTCHRGDPFPEQ